MLRRRARHRDADPAGLRAPSGGSQGGVCRPRLRLRRHLPAAGGGQIDAELSQLRDLDGDDDTVKAIYDAAQQGVDQAKQDPTLLLQSNPAPFKKANKLANDYGLTVCAS